MAENELKVQIPNEIITSIVKAQVVAALGKSDELVRAVIESALNQKRDSYSKETLFEAAVVKMIQEEAQEVFKAWLSENKEKIGAEFKRQLGIQKGKVISGLVESFVKQLTNIYASVKLAFPGAE